MCGLGHCQEALAESSLVRTSFLRFLNLGVNFLGRGLQNILLLSVSGVISAVCCACRVGTASLARLCYCLLLVRGSWAMQTQDAHAKVGPEASRHPRPIPTPCRALQSGLMPRPCGEHKVRPPTGVKHSQPTRGLPREGDLAPASRNLVVAKRPIAFWKRGFATNPHPTAAEAILGSDIDAELAFGDVKLGFTARHLHALFRPQFRTLSIAECLAALPQDRQYALVRLVRGYGDDLPDGLVCYTDGSFFPATQLQDPSAGWSCVFLDKTRQTCDILSGKLPPWCAGANAEMSAFKAECCALAVAIWLGTAVLEGSPLRIFSDCKAALAIAQGTAAAHVGGVAAVLEHVSECCRAVSRSPHVLTYLPGHTGILGNELADFAAKSGALSCGLGQLRWTGPGEPDWWANNGTLWSWGGVVCRWARGDDALPSPLAVDLSLDRCSGGLGTEDILSPFLPQQGPCPDREQCGAIKLRVVSYNALSLATERGRVSEEGIAFSPAKPALLAKQLDSAGIHCAAIQEARTAEGYVNTGFYLRFCSGCRSGHLGVELWFRSGHPLWDNGSGSEASVRFDAAHFVVLFQDPRRLAVLFRKGGCQLVFAALHAPHRGHNAEDIQAWWTETEGLLHRASSGHLLIVGADCNASLGSVETDHVSHHGGEEQDQSGALLHACLLKWGLWAPATFAHVQEGPTWTFAQRRNGALARPDFVFMPVQWRLGWVRAWTDPSIMAANMVLDHIATVVEVTVRTKGAGAPKTSKPPRIDVQALADPANRDTIQGILRDAPRPNWRVSASVHVASVTSYLQTSLGQAFPPAAKRPLHPYISADTWELQKQVTWLRRKCAAVRQALHTQFLSAAFLAWRRLPAVADAGRSAWLREWQVAEALYGFRLGTLVKVLRHRCKEDRAAYVAALADEVQAGTVKSFHAVNRLLCRRRKKPFAPAVLPAIREQSGALCGTPAEAARRWREHFSAIEDGVEVTREQLVALDADGSGMRWPSPPSISSLPTPVVLQHALLATKKGKACGPDALPGELGLFFADDMQRILFPLMLKLGLLGEEGLGHKSGTLTRLWKGRGSHADCTSYRGILLLSNLCKAIHRAYRPSLRNHFTCTTSPLQLGGKPGCSVIFGSHLTRSFMRWRSSQGQTSAVLFADVSSAYYCARRELASRPHGTRADEPAASEPDDPLTLAYQLRAPSALEQANAHPWLCAMTTAINSNTWMHLKDDHIPIITRRGTRPGSAWADLSFGVIVGRILRLRDNCRAPPAAGCVTPSVPWDGYRHWGPVAEPHTWLALDDLVWADDLSTCINVACAEEAAAVVASEAGALTDAFHSHGFELSFGPRKTAAIVSLRGPGARAARRALFAGKAELCVLREQVGPAALPLVDQYKHLGVVQAGAGCIRREIHQRCAAAWTAFREGRTRVFRCKRVSLRRRGILLNMLVLSKLLYGAGAWPPLKAGEMRKFTGALFSIYRATLGLRATDDQHLSVSAICTLLDLPDPATLLRVEQLRYLKQLCCAAPDVLWALLRCDGPFLGLIRDSLQWLYARVQSTCAWPDPNTHWEEWSGLIRDRPSIFTGLIKRARGLELCRINCYAALRALYRTIHQASAGSELAEVVEGATCTEACLICRRGFVSRAAWACHSSKKHGYRIPASILVGHKGRTLCGGCGKVYATSARLRRHLLHATACRANWGAFQTDECEQPPQPNHAEPPTQALGHLAPDVGGDDPAAYNKGLFEVLSGLEAPTAEAVWENVVEYVEPLDILRATVRRWQAHLGSQPGIASAAEDVLLMLDPSLCCDSFGSSRPSVAPADCFGDLPGPLAEPISFVLSGPVRVFRLDAPPCSSFQYPFIGSATLAAARRQAAYVEAACDVLGAAVQQAAISRVQIIADGKTLTALEPAATWLLSIGFVGSSKGLSSPDD